MLLVHSSNGCRRNELSEGSQGGLYSSMGDPAGGLPTLSQGHCGAVTSQSGGAPSPCFGVYRRARCVNRATARCSAALRPLRGDFPCARRSARGQVGTKGWSSRSNQGMGPRSGRGGLGGIFRVEGGLGFKHGASDGEEPIGDAAQGAAMAMTAFAQSGAYGREPRCPKTEFRGEGRRRLSVRRSQFDNRVASVGTSKGSPWPPESKPNRPDGPVSTLCSP